MWAGEHGWLEATVRSVRRSEPVPDADPIRYLLRDARQRTALVVEDVQGETGIELGIVRAPSREPPLLVVLDQVVIGVAGERQRVQTLCLYPLA